MGRKTAVTFAASAIGDLEDILGFYKEQAIPQVGQRLVSKIISDIELLASQPEISRVVPEFELDFLRELIRPPFRIVYRYDSKRIRIVRIWRSERLLVLPEE
ncbi:MAG: type II toxin-antitoxin system RelE/ParE family toxin [Proteobacteria bacterium]|nr:type II toxin-antitoxin system RelE/ParE family toxin [Pseudomonadota bacterium]MBU1736964.1 type II toxin-antitoxin system RelE/ParE family toxin [Pseudomonadota bacterium]